MARSSTRALAATLLATLVALLLAACSGGGGGDGGEDLTTGLGARELLDRSSAEAAKVETFRISFDATGQIDLAQGAAGTNLLSGPLSVSGEGPVQTPDRASVDATLELGALSPEVNLTRVGSEVFLGVLGQDFRLALPPEQVALLDFAALFPTLAGWMTDPAIAGREDVDGTETVKVTGGVDAVAAFADLGPLLGTDDATVRATPEAELRRALSEGAVEAWIGTEDLLPRRVHIVLKGDGAGVVEGVGRLDVDLTATLSGYGEPVDISAPSDARPLDLDQLGALTGG